jgi:hypothetical protein
VSEADSHPIETGAPGKACVSDPGGEEIRDG